MLYKHAKRQDRRRRIKARMTSDKLRLVVFRSTTHTYAQIIDDTTGKTLVAASDLKMKKGTKTEKAMEVGKELAAKAVEKKLSVVVFDRAGYQYHGRIKALADSAREGGLQF